MQLISIPPGTVQCIRDMMMFPDGLNISKHIPSFLTTDEVSQKSYNRIQKCHCNFLRQYIDHGRDFDWKSTKYYQQYLTRNKPWSEGMIERRILSFFALYEDIKRQGFGQENSPVMVVDLRNLIFVNSIQKPLQYWRWNGGHRCAIALVLSIQEMPVYVAVAAERDL